MSDERSCRRRGSTAHSYIYDLHRAGILYDIDDMTDEEIGDAALEKVRKPGYNRSVMQAPRVAPPRKADHLRRFLVSAPQK